MDLQTLLTPSHVLATNNFVASIGLLFSALVMFIFALRRNKLDYMTVSLIGASLEALSWALHRGYYLLFNLMAIFQDPSYISVWREYQLTASVTTTTMALIGIAMTLSILTSHFFGKAWILASITILLATWLLGLELSVYIVNNN